MPPAAAIGEDQLGISLQTSLVLSTSRAFISLSQKLCWDFEISEQNKPAESAAKLAAAIKSGAQVFKQSIHHYCLRESLALADDALAKNCSLSALPPPYMVNAISAQQIVGFCAGEPWNIQAQIQGYSWVIAGSKQIIPEVADNVLALTQEWVKLYPEALTAIETAIQLAQHDLKTLSCLDQVWQMP